MLHFPNIDPVLLSFGPLQVRWYGLMYVLGFTASYFLVRHQIKENGYARLAEHFENINLVLILSVVVGGRLGYVLFYNLQYYLSHPFEILATWTGGMSFHGACLALILAGWFYTRRHGIDFWKAADIYVATIPIGLGLGRIGNFINGELFGKVTESPWGMVFPYGGPSPRHPSQLYEAALEGILLFTILWMCRNKPWQVKSNWPHGTILSLFLIFYGMFRMVIELFREPDSQLGYLFGVFTMGQLLSFLMVLAGILLLVFRIQKHNNGTDSQG
jgi:phosphatidylglycerol:prolipoprotein diacylglycerol transferase